MHILLMSRVVLAHGIRGGMERHAEILMEGLEQRGHRVTVVTTALPLGVEAPGGARSYHFLPGTSQQRYTTTWWRSSAAAVRAIVSDDRPDLVWSQSVAGLGLPKEQGLVQSIPVVSVIHGTALGELRGSWRAWRHAPSARGLAVVAMNSWRRIKGPYVWRQAVSKLSRWIAVSEQVADDLGYLGVERERVSVVPNGIDTARFRPDLEARAEVRAELGLEQESIVAVVAGRLTRQKGIDVAIRALARVPDLCLVVAGDGSARKDLERLAQRLGLAEHVHFIGSVPYWRVPALLAAADIGLMPSLLEEAFPLSLIEAMATGLAVIASRVGGVPSAVRPGVDGELVRPGDVEALATALGQLAADASRRAELGANARKRALAQYDTQQMVEATEAVFEKSLR